MKRGAFTMIELVFVIVIIGILATFAIPQFSEVQEGAKKSRVEGFISLLRSKLVSRYEYNGYIDLNSSSYTLPTIITTHLGDSELASTYSHLSQEGYISFSSTPLYNTTSTPVIVCVGQGASATSTGCQQGSNDYNISLKNELKKDLQGRDLSVITLFIARPIR